MSTQLNLKIEQMRLHMVMDANSSPRDVLIAGYIASAYSDRVENFDPDVFSFFYDKVTDKFFGTVDQLESRLEDIGATPILDGELLATLEAMEAA